MQEEFSIIATLRKLQGYGRVLHQKSSIPEPPSSSPETALIKVFLQLPN